MPGGDENAPTFPLSSLSLSHSLNPQKKHSIKNKFPTATLRQTSSSSKYNKHTKEKPRASTWNRFAGAGEKHVHSRRRPKRLCLPLLIEIGTTRNDGGWPAAPARGEGKCGFGEENVFFRIFLFIYSFKKY